jgi:hypothetical protein
MQISTLFSKFQADGDAMKPALVRGSLAPPPVVSPPRTT